MASLSKRGNRWIIQFVSPDGSRKTLSLKATRARDKGQSQAAALKGHIEELVTCLKSGTGLSPLLQRWIDGLPDSTHQQLVEAGLLTTRDMTVSTLGPFLDSWFEERADQKKSTLLVWGNAKRNLIEFFGSDKPLRDINEADAESFERWLKSDQQLSESTIRKRCGFAKQMLQTAVKARLIDQNPLQALKVAAIGNKKRQYFVTEAESQTVLAACPNTEWKACFVLARYGALRIPSEIQELRWSDINWEQNRFHVHATKTEHHESGGDRLVPIFPEVRKVLNELWDELGDKPGEFVLPHIRSISNVNPQLGRIIKNAGLKAWPKRWQNLRATRATELEREFPSHVVTGWCGHTARIAEQHYWMTTEDDFQRAATMKGAALALQHPVAEGSLGQKPEPPAQKKSPEKPGSAKSCTVVRKTSVEDNGLEPMTFWLPARRSPN
jgi:integrase